MLTWQAVQLTPVCAPVSGNAVRLWLMLAPAQVEVLWQEAQLVLTALLCGVEWQAEQVEGVPT